MKSPGRKQCDECRELTAHEFRSADDLIHAVRLAAEEVDRGVLERVNPRDLDPRSQEALDSSLESGALPDHLNLRFRCRVCGDLFTLAADTATGAGQWSRDVPV